MEIDAQGLHRILRLLHELQELVVGREPYSVQSQKMALIANVLAVHVLTASLCFT